MTTTIKKIREMMDCGLITVEETTGIKVKVGFMILVITGYRETQGDFLPNVWQLESKGKQYEFTPYHGLALIS